MLWLRGYGPAFYSARIMASALTASPSPMGPRPSAVFAFTEMLLTGIPMMPESLVRICFA